VGARDQRAEDKLREHEGEDELGQGRGVARCRSSRRERSFFAERRREPDERHEKQAREEEMRRKIERLDRGHAGLQARGDHDPADHPLESEKHARSGKRGAEAP
jgi:hypothetical protein